MIEECDLSLSWTKDAAELTLPGGEKMPLTVANYCPYGTWEDIVKEGHGADRWSCGDQRHARVNVYLVFE